MTEVAFPVFFVVKIHFNVLNKFFVLFETLLFDISSIFFSLVYIKKIIEGIFW